MTGEISSPPPPPPKKKKKKKKKKNVWELWLSIGVRVWVSEKGIFFKLPKGLFPVQVWVLLWSLLSKPMWHIIKQ